MGSSSREAKQPVYKIQFYNQGELYEIYARQVYQGSMYGFVEVEELIFGERSEVLVDPSEERLKSEFSGVKRTYIPMHSVVRIDEVEKQGQSRISSVDENSKVTPFPMSNFGPAKDTK